MYCLKSNLVQMSGSVLLNNVHSELLLSHKKEITTKIHIA